MRAPGLRSSRELVGLDVGWSAHPERGVSTAAVAEELDVGVDRAVELDPLVPPRAGERLDLRPSLHRHMTAAAMKQGFQTQDAEPDLGRVLAHLIAPAP